jgi:xylulokinase
MPPLASLSARLVVSLDASTTACKAIAWDPQGRPLAEGRAPYPTHQPQVGWHEQDAADWWAAACRALRDCLAALPAGFSPNAVDAVAFTHQRETFVPVDAAGAPLRRAILWNDERSAPQVAALAARYGDDLATLTGKPPSLTASIAKLLWLVEREPHVVAATAHFLDVHAYLVYHLTGVLRTSLASADPMGVVAMQARTWAADLIADLGLAPSQFVELAAPGELLGRVTPTAAAATGLPEGLPVIAGAGDGQCAGLGANITAAGRGYLNLGTGIAAGAYSADYLCDRAFRTLIAPTEGGYYLEHILRGGVYTVAWFVRNFAADLLHQGAAGPSPEAQLEAAAAGIPPGAEGLLLVPYWNSVMNPYWDPLAAGITVGWRGHHTRAHFYRAILEGIAFEQRLVGDAIMAAAETPFDRYLAMGGGARSALWLQIFADVTGVPVVPAATAEATCLGAGVLAAYGAGWYPTIAAAAAAMAPEPTATIYTPGVQAAIYEGLYRGVYCGLYPALRDSLARLATLPTHYPQSPL